MEQIYYKQLLDYLQKKNTLEISEMFFYMTEILKISPTKAVKIINRLIESPIVSYDNERVQLII